MQSEDFRSKAVEQLQKVHAVKEEYLYLSKFKETCRIHNFHHQQLSDQLQIARPLAIQIADFIVFKELQLERQGDNLEFVLEKLAGGVCETI